MTLKFIQTLFITIPLLMIPSCSALVSKKVLLLQQHSPISTLRHNDISLLATLSPEAPTITKEKTSQDTKKEKRQSCYTNGGADTWEVRIFDNDHHYDYQVATILVKVADLSELQAYRAMRSAEAQGQARIGEYDFEIAELYVSLLRDQGLGCDMFPLDLQ